MKIAHIAPAWLPIPPKNYGGTEIVLYDLIEAQIAQGHHVTLFAPEDARTSAKLVSFLPRSLRAEGVPWAAHLKADYHLRRSLEAVVAMDVDVVHTHLSVSNDLSLFPLLAHLETPHITTLHSQFPFDHVSTWIGDADNYYLQTWGASVPVVAISKQASKKVPPGLRVAGVVYNGLSLQRYRFTPTPPKQDSYLVWLGRFVPEKGAHLAIQAAKQAHVPLVLAGVVDKAVPEVARYFEQEIEPHIDQQQIRYIGSVDSARKNKLFSGARGMLNPIEWEEPFGMVMIEAMASGCPVISFARGAAPELIVHGKTGFLVDTVDAMVQAIPQLAQIDRQRARSHVEHTFSAGAMASNYEQVYQREIASLIKDYALVYSI